MKKVKQLTAESISNKKKKTEREQAPEKEEDEENGERDDDYTEDDESTDWEAIPEGLCEFAKRMLPGDSLWHGHPAAQTILEWGDRFEQRF